MTTGNRPRFVPRELLSLTDLERLRDAPFLDRELVDGALMGACEGVLTPCQIWFENVDNATKLLRFGEMVLCGFKNEGPASNLASGVVVRFSPTSPAQIQTTVNIAFYQGSSGAIWWRAESVPSDLGNRRRWESGFPLGRGEAINTMLRTRVYFTVTSGFNDPPPNTSSPWFRLAHFVFPNNQTPTVRLMHAFDLGYERTPTLSIGKVLGQSMLANHNPNSNAGRSFSIVRALAVLANVIMAIKDRDHAWDLETMEITHAGSEDLLARTYRGLKQLDEDLNALNATVTIGHGERLNVLEDLAQGHGLRLTSLENINTTSTKVLYSAEVASDATITKQYGEALRYGSVTCTAVGTGIRVFDFPLATDGVAVVTTKPVNNAGFGRVSISWPNPGQLRVETYNATGAPINVAFTVQVTGNFT
jgi:hypothetical protein